MKPIYCILLLLLLLIPVVAIDNSTVSVFTDTNATINATIGIHANTTAYLNNTIRIDQDDCVVPGETLDIAGLGWYTGKITYYGKYYDNYASSSTTDIVDTYPVDIWHLNNFYLDPSYFTSRLGWWYIYNPIEDQGTTITSHGNDRIFKVSLSCVLTPKGNASAFQEAINRSQEIAALLKNKTYLPIRTEPNTDYILSRYSITTVDEPNADTRWIFGTSNSDKYYDTTVNNVSTFSISDLAPGNYDVVYISSGKNGIMEERYDPSIKSITSPFKVQPDISLYGIQPRVAETLLTNMIHASIDDTYVIKHLMVQEPQIDIMKLAQSTLSNYQDRPTVFSIAGYTNANQDSTVKIQVDADKVAGNPSAVPFQMAYVIDNGGEVAYRSWNKTFQVNMNGFSIGQHSVTVTNAEGATATIPFYIKSEPVANYVPNVTLNYISNNPFIPTPTPQVIEHQVIVTQTVPVIITVPVTPSQQQLDDASWNAIIAVTIAGIVVFAVTLILGYGLSLVIRAIISRRKKQ